MGHPEPKGEGSVPRLRMPQLSQILRVTQNDKISRKMCGALLVHHAASGRTRHDAVRLSSGGHPEPMAKDL
jgi:hypothetical protein